MVLEGCGATTRACCAMRLPRRTLSTDNTITGISIHVCPRAERPGMCIAHASNMIRDVMHFKLFVPRSVLAGSDGRTKEWCREHVEHRVRGPRRADDGRRAPTAETSVVAGRETLARPGEDGTGDRDDHQVRSIAHSDKRKHIEAQIYRTCT